MLRDMPDITTGYPSWDFCQKCGDRVARAVLRIVKK